MSGVLAYMDFPGIHIIGGPTFTGQASTALMTLRSKARGKALLKEITLWLSHRGVTITIEAAAGFEGQEGSGWDGGTRTVRWSPAARPNESDDPDQLNGIPPFVILGHELCHALHTLQGTDSYGGGKRDDIAVEEVRTIGLGPWATDMLSENGLRGEWSYKLRTTFQQVGVDKLLKGTKYAA